MPICVSPEKSMEQEHTHIVWKKIWHIRCKREATSIALLDSCLSKKTLTRNLVQSISSVQSPTNQESVIYLFRLALAAALHGIPGIIPPPSLQQLLTFDSKGTIVMTLSALLDLAENERAVDAETLIATLEALLLLRGFRRFCCFWWC